MQIQALFISLLTTLSFAAQKNDVVIVGGGIVGLFEAYQTAKDAQDNNETITITVLEKHQTRFDTTTANIVPSLTIDEILAVVPRGANLIASLQKKFYEGEGIRVEDIDNESETVTQLIKAAKNARVTTHLGSGGVSCAFGAIEASKNPASTLHYFADSRR